MKMGKWINALNEWINRLDKSEFTVQLLYHELWGRALNINTVMIFHFYWSCFLERHWPFPLLHLVMPPLFSAIIITKQWSLPESFLVACRWMYPKILCLLSAFQIFYLGRSVTTETDPIQCLMPIVRLPINIHPFSWFLELFLRHACKPPQKSGMKHSLTNK